MGKKTEIWLDTNIIIYTFRTNGDFSIRARELVKNATEGKYTLKISPIIIQETVYVLQGKQFRLSKTDIEKLIVSFINLKGIDCEEKSVIEEALGNYNRNDVDFGDAYLAAHARAVTPAHIITYNVKDFLNLGVQAETPFQLARRESAAAEDEHNKGK